MTKLLVVDDAYSGQTVQLAGASPDGVVFARADIAVPMAADFGFFAFDSGGIDAPVTWNDPNLFQRATAAGASGPFVASELSGSNWTANKQGVLTYEGLGSVVVSYVALLSLYPNAAALGGLVGGQLSKNGVGIGTADVDPWSYTEGGSGFLSQASSQVVELTVARTIRVSRGDTLEVILFGAGAVWRAAQYRVSVSPSVGLV